MFMDRKKILSKYQFFLLTYRVNSFSIKIPENYFADMSKLILKCIWRQNGSE